MIGDLKGLLETLASPLWPSCINLQIGVRLSDGSEFYAKTIISNATRWDTFGKFGQGATL